MKKLFISLVLIMAVLVVNAQNPTTTAKPHHKATTEKTAKAVEVSKPAEAAKPATQAVKPTTKAVVKTVPKKK